MSLSRAWNCAWTDGRFDFAALNGNTTLFPQEPEIFENTIRYNITLGLPLPEEEVNAVCRGRILRRRGRGVAEGSRFEHSGKGRESVRRAEAAAGAGARIAGGARQRGGAAGRAHQQRGPENRDTHLRKYVPGVFAARRWSRRCTGCICCDTSTMSTCSSQGRIVDEGTFQDLRVRSAAFGELWRHQEETVVTTSPRRQQQRLETAIEKIAGRAENSPASASGEGSREFHRGR